MKKATMSWGAVVTALALCAVPAMGVSYVELTPWGTIEAGTTSGSHYAMAIDGQTSYHALNLSPGGGSITVVENLNGLQTASVLMSNAAWVAASSATNLTSSYGFGISGDYVQFSDSGTDQVWRVHKTTGAISAYADQSAILAATGASSVSLLTPTDTAPNGEMVFYEGASDSILITNGVGNVSVLVSATELLAATGNSTVSGGMTFQGNNLYFGSSASDTLYRYDGGTSSGGMVETVLSTADILAVSGNSAAGFGDILAAPDGNIYFYESTDDNIMRFNPADPANTLEIYISEDELLAGPMASDGVVSLSWYDGFLAFHRYSTYGTFVAVPEPASLCLLALGGLAVLRRRR